MRDYRADYAWRTVITAIHIDKERLLVIHDHPTYFDYFKIRKDEINDDPVKVFEKYRNNNYK